MYTAGAAGSGGIHYAFDQATGSIAWTQTVNTGENSSPAVTADGVYVSYPCSAYDFRPATGDSVWNNTIELQRWRWRHAGVLTNQLVYSPNSLAGYNGSILNAETGAGAGSYVADTPAAFTANTGYFLQSGTLHGVALSNNTVSWSFAGDGALSVRRCS